MPATDWQSTVGRTWQAKLRQATAGVRFRTTLIAVVVVGIMVAVGLLYLALETRNRIEESITSAAETRAADVVTLIEAGAIEDQVQGISDDMVVQVVDTGGRVVTASVGLESLGRFADVTPGVGQVEVLRINGIFEELEDISPFVEDESPYRVVVLGFELGTVQVAVSLEPADAAVDALRPLLLTGFPILLAAVGLIVWRLTGRALHPVESMREEAAAVSALALDRRLPVPDSQDEIHRLAVTLNSMLERLESAAVSQRRFIADASHELKSPITAMRTMLEVADQTPGFDDWENLLHDLMGEDRRLGHLVGDLLTLARADERASPVRREELDLDRLVGIETESARGRYPDVAINTSGLVPMRMWGDTGSLRRLLANLVENACRHATTSVTVGSRATDQGFFVLVGDDGPGIPPAERERVFERFVRLDESRSRGEGGTGLGLAVARAIARSHGGDIRVVDADQGATLEVSLPVGRPG